MVILGIDPGLAQTGYGLVDYTQRRFQVRAYGAIRTPADHSTAQRVAQIHAKVAELIAVHQPEVLVMEQLFTLRSGSTALSIGQAMGVILLAAAQAEVPVVQYAPPQIKQAVVGYGDATKEQVQYMVQRILKLPEPPSPVHAADALAMCICHVHTALGALQSALPSPTPQRAQLEAALAQTGPSKRLKDRIAAALEAEEKRRQAYRARKDEKDHGE